MKVARFVLALGLLGVSLPAQTSSPDLLVLEYHWHKNFHPSNWDRPGPAYRMTRGGVLAAEQREMIREYVYQVKVQNNGTKTITALD